MGFGVWRAPGKNGQVQRPGRSKARSTKKSKRKLWIPLRAARMWRPQHQLARWYPAFAVQDSGFRDCRARTRASRIRESHALRSEAKPRNASMARGVGRNVRNRLRRTGAPESRARVGLPAERYTLPWIPGPYRLSPRVKPGLIRSRMGQRVPRNPAPPRGQEIWQFLA